MTMVSYAPVSSRVSFLAPASKPMSVSNLAVPLPSTTVTARPPVGPGGLVYRPQSGTIVDGPQLNDGGLVQIPVPGFTDPNAETEGGLSDRFWAWWQPMPIASKGLAVGAAVAVLGGAWWLLWGRKKKATPNARRGTVKHRGTVRKRRLARYKAYGTSHGPGGSVGSVPPGKKLYRARLKKR